MKGLVGGALLTAMNASGQQNKSSKISHDIDSDDDDDSIKDD